MTSACSPSANLTQLFWSKPVWDPESLSVCGSQFDLIKYYLLNNIFNES